jgi:IS605 OrfB family transposase
MNKLPIKINVPKLIQDKEIKVVKLIPKYNGAFFEAHFTYIDDSINEDKEIERKEVMAVDFGVNNLITAVASNKTSFIIDGKHLKSINQYYNKQISILKSINAIKGLNSLSNKMIQIMSKRENQVDYYLYKSAKMLINKAIEENVGTIILGYNKGLKQNINIGKVNNQNFVSIPLDKLKRRISLLAKAENIKIIIQEESYTSKASFFDNDEIPVYDENKIHKFSGKRIKRGLYKTSNGSIINADLNAALNILKKSKLDKKVILFLQSSGVNTPIRLKVV